MTSRETNNSETNNAGRHNGTDGISGRGTDTAEVRTQIVLSFDAE